LIDALETYRSRGGEAIIRAGGSREDGYAAAGDVNRRTWKIRALANGVGSARRCACGRCEAARKSRRFIVFIGLERVDRCNIRHVGHACHAGRAG
jgi:hypothetical protein